MGEALAVLECTSSMQSSMQSSYSGLGARNVPAPAPACSSPVPGLGDHHHCSRLQPVQCACAAHRAYLKLLLAARVAEPPAAAAATCRASVVTWAQSPDSSGALAARLQARDRFSGKSHQFWRDRRTGTRGQPPLPNLTDGLATGVAQTHGRQGGGSGQRTALHQTEG